MAEGAIDEIETFHHLEAEVLRRGLCDRCGGCVSFCSSGELGALGFDEDGLPRYVDEKKCLTCGICYLICPRTRALDRDIQKKFSWKPPIGSYQTVASARTRDEEVKKVCTDGGVVTSLIVYLLDRGLIDGAIVSRKTDVFGREPTIATNREEIIMAAGSQFSASSHLGKLGEEFTTYSPVVSSLKSLGAKRFVKLAIVGSPAR
ncbi:MAG: coenzyme F420 hydrogenase/dehydrogenase beta subunit N-terminal domain-containing protein [bacterium]